MDGRRADIQARVAALVGGEVVIWADQNAPRPALPYWTLRLQTQASLGTPDYSQGVTAGGVQTVDGVREETLQVQRLGPGAFDRVAQLRDDLGRLSILAAWQAVGLAVFRTGDVQNAPFKLDGEQLEPRAALDLFLRYNARTLDTVGAIETVTTAAGYVTPASAPAENADLDQIISVVYTGP